MSVVQLLTHYCQQAAGWFLLLFVILPVMLVTFFFLVPVCWALNALGERPRSPL